jgi:2'-5' RNA ligase
VGRFDGRALWVGCRGDVVSLRRLASSVRAAGRRAGAAVDERRRFRAHVTLARSSRPVDLRPHVLALAAYEGPEWAAGDIALVRSHLDADDRGRPRYETVSRYPLSSHAVGRA